MKNPKIRSNKFLHEVFFEMEEEFNLFDLKTENNLPFWDTIRAQVLSELVEATHNKIQVENRIGYKTFSKKIDFLTKYLLSFVKFLFVKYDDLFFANSRFIDKQGFSFDPYLDCVKCYLSKKLIIFESNDLDKQYKYKNIVFNPLPLLHKLRIYFFLSKYKNSAQKNIEIVSDAIYKKFNISINEKVYHNIFYDFLYDYYYYKFLIKFKNLKRIFVVQNGIQKGLFYAALKLNVPTFEFQHGDIVDSSLVYNYKSLDPLIKSNIIYPRFLLTFSNLWVKEKNIPSECIETGNDFLYFEKNKLNYDKTITIISSDLHNETLQNLAIELSKNFNLKIYFKLHPSQFPSFKDIECFFSEIKNIEVVALEKNVKDLIKISDEFIIIYSTAIFEVLQSGKIVYIFKRQDYEKFEKYFDLPNVYLFNDVDELKEKRILAFNLFSDNKTPEFFKKFDSIKFSEFISLV